jgi:hypothetical protein
MSKAADLANLIGNINAGGGGVNRNVIINGAMNVSKYATTATGVGASDGYFTCDRWHLDSGATTAGRLTMTQDINDAPSGFGNSLKLDCTTADTSIASGEILKIEQRIEGQNLQTFKKGTSDAKPFAVSFYVKGNASATYVCELFDQDNSRQCSKTFNVTTDWTRVELTFPADTTGAFDNDNAHSLSLNFWLHAGASFTSGTLNSSGFAANNGPDRAAGISSFFDSTDRTFFLTGVQLEVGQNPTEFEHENIKITEEKCRRYLIAYGGEKNYETIVGSGIAASTTRCWFLYTPGQMRAIPTLTHANIQVDHPGVAGYGLSSYTLDSAASSKGIFSYADVSSGLTAGKPYALIGTNASDAGRGYVRLSAEL